MNLNSNKGGVYCMKKYLLLLVTLVIILLSGSFIATASLPPPPPPPAQPAPPPAPTPPPVTCSSSSSTSSGTNYSEGGAYDYTYGPPSTPTQNSDVHDRYLSSGDFSSSYTTYYKTDTYQQPYTTTTTTTSCSDGTGGTSSSTSNGSSSFYRTNYYSPVSSSSISVSYSGGSPAGGTVTFQATATSPGGTSYGSGAAYYVRTVTINPLNGHEVYAGTSATCTQTYGDGHTAVCSPSSSATGMGTYDRVCYTFTNSLSGNTDTKCSNQYWVTRMTLTINLPDSYHGVNGPATASNVTCTYYYSDGTTNNCNPGPVLSSIQTYKDGVHDKYTKRCYNRPFTGHYYTSPSSLFICSNHWYVNNINVWYDTASQTTLDVEQAPSPLPNCIAHFYHDPSVTKDCRSGLYLTEHQDVGMNGSILRYLPKDTPATWNSMNANSSTGVTQVPTYSIVRVYTGVGGYYNSYLPTTNGYPGWYMTGMGYNVPEATKIRVHFSYINLATNHAFIYFPPDLLGSKITGSYSDYWSPWANGTGYYVYISTDNYNLNPYVWTDYYEYEKVTYTPVPTTAVDVNENAGILPVNQINYSQYSYTPTYFAPASNLERYYERCYNYSENLYNDANANRDSCTKHYSVTNATTTIDKVKTYEDETPAMPVCLRYYSVGGTNNVSKHCENDYFNSPTNYSTFDFTKTNVNAKQYTITYKYAYDNKNHFVKQVATDRIYTKSVKITGPTDTYTGKHAIYTCIATFGDNTLRDISNSSTNPNYANHPYVWSGVKLPSGGNGGGSIGYDWKISGFQDPRGISLKPINDNDFYSPDPVGPYDVNITCTYYNKNGGGANGSNKNMGNLPYTSNKGILVPVPAHQNPQTNTMLVKHHGIKDMKVTASGYFAKPNPNSNAVSDMYSQQNSSSFPAMPNGIGPATNWYPTDHTPLTASKFGEGNVITGDYFSKDFITGNWYDFRAFVLYDDSTDGAGNASYREVTSASETYWKAIPWYSNYKPDSKDTKMIQTGGGIYSTTPYLGTTFSSSGLDHRIPANGYNEIEVYFYDNTYSGLFPKKTNQKIEYWAHSIETASITGTNTSTTPVTTANVGGTNYYTLKVTWSDDPSKPTGTKNPFSTPANRGKPEDWTKVVQWYGDDYVNGSAASGQAKYNFLRRGQQDSATVTARFGDDFGGKLVAGTSGDTFVNTGGNNTEADNKGVNYFEYFYKDLKVKLIENCSLDRNTYDPIFGCSYVASNPQLGINTKIQSDPAYYPYKPDAAWFAAEAPFDANKPPCGGVGNPLCPSDLSNYILIAPNQYRGKDPNFSDIYRFRYDFSVTGVSNGVGNK
jgi:hypothetical protein